MHALPSSAFDRLQESDACGPPKRVEQTRIRDRGRGSRCRRVPCRAATNPGAERLLIIDATLPAATSQIRRLSESLAGQPIVALAESDSSRAALLQSGAAEVAQLPLQTDDLRAILERVSGSIGASGAIGTSRSNCRSVVVWPATEGERMHNSLVESRVRACPIAKPSVHSRRAGRRVWPPGQSPAN